MFVISQCWSNMRKDPCNAKLSLPDQMGVALKHAGVSITITTVTDIFAFGVGAFSVSYRFIKSNTQIKTSFRCSLDYNHSVSAQPWLWEQSTYFKLPGLLPGCLSTKNALLLEEMGACLVLYQRH